VGENYCLNCQSRAGREVEKAARHGGIHDGARLSSGRGKARYGRRI
jgi:hypothetical protein